MGKLFKWFLVCCGVIGAIFVLGAIIVAITVEDTETKRVALQAATLITVLVGLGFTYWQLHLFRKAQEDLYDWNRRHAAQEAIDDMVPRLSSDTLMLDEKFNILTEHDRISLDEIKRECENDKAVRGALNRRLNYFESLAAGVHQGVFDEKIIKNSYR